MSHSQADESQQSNSKMKETSEKRKAQLRQAQRTYRERTRAYQEALEQEIIKLRADHSVELHSCKAEISFLRQLLQANGIPIPQQILDKTDHLMTFVQTDFQPQNRSFLQVRRNLDQNDMVSRATTAQSVAFGGFSNRTSPGLMHGLQTLNVAYSIESAPPDLLQLAINFILHLEHPCLEHAHLLSARQASNCHAFTSSTAMFSFSQDLPQELVRQSRNREIRTWLSPAVRLTNLLSLCDQFVPEGEVSPVQMWRRITQLLEQCELRLAALPDLKRTLAAKMECRGFGSAMEEHDFEAILAAAKR